LRIYTTDAEYDSELTIVEVRNGFQDVAVGVKSLWSADSTGGVPVRVQDDLGVDEITGGDSLVKSLAKSDGGCHVWRLFERTTFVTGLRSYLCGLQTPRDLVRHASDTRHR